MAIVKGDDRFLALGAPLLRVHSECFTGDVLHSLRCDCGEQLDVALKKIQEEGQGVVIYLKQEGRGIGLLNKVRAYKLQDQGLDTVEANQQLGFAADLRDYTMAGQILKYFGIQKARIMTNNPQKLKALHDLGAKSLMREALEISAHAQNYQYLLTKKTKLGHWLTSRPENQ
jgi:GTP cyclohydrolase II